MKTLNFFFFYTYIGLVLIAGFWGAFLGAQVDHQFLLNLEISSLTAETRANVLTQYRFLRAIELGFGLFAIACRTEIFTIKKFSALFLVIMFFGVLARIVSLITDGSPHWIFYFFMIYEGIGVIIIYLYSRKKVWGKPNDIDGKVYL